MDLNSKRRITMFWMAWKNIHLNWRHSLSTMLAIMAGFVAVSLFDGFLREVEWQSYDGYVNRGMIGHVTIEKLGARKMLDEDPWGFSLGTPEQNFIEQFIAKNRGNILARTRFLDFSGMVSNGKSSTVFQGAGVDTKEGLIMRGPRWGWNTEAGVPLHLAAAQSMTLATGLARFLDCHFDSGKTKNPDGTFIAVERPFECPRTSMQVSVTTETTQINAMDFKVSGLVDLQIREYNERYLEIPIEMAQKLLDTEKVTRISLLLKDEAQTNETIQKIKSESMKAGIPLDAYGWLEHPAAHLSKGGLEILSIFRSLFLTIVAVVAIMSVANTMMKSINERIREIGTLRSFGFRKSDITLVFAAEGFLLGIISCAFGLVISLILASLISKMGISYRAGVLSTPLDVRIQNAPTVWLLSAIGLSLLCMGTAWITARRAAKMIIADALRHVA